MSKYLMRERERERERDGTSSLKRRDIILEINKLFVGTKLYCKCAIYSNGVNESLRTPWNSLQAMHECALSVR